MSLHEVSVPLEWKEASIIPLVKKVCRPTRAYFFILYINDLEEGVTSKIMKFAYATKLFRTTKDIVDILFLELNEEI